MNQKKDAKTLVDYLYIFLKRRKLIILNFVVVVILTYIVALFLPKWYYSQATVLPPKEDIGGGLASLIGISRQLGIGGAGMMAEQTGAYNYLSILKSRTLQEDVISKFDLFNVYNVSDSSYEKILKILNNNVKFEFNEEGALVIGFYDQNPERSAAIANFFVERLHYYSVKLSLQEAKAQRELIEKRLEQNEQDLADLEEKILSLQKNFALIIGPEQFDLQNKAVIDLFAQYVIKELQVEIYQKTLGENNQLYKTSLVELNILKEKLKDVPEQTVESSRIFRDFLIQQKIMELLTPLYEQAKLQEMKETPTVLILDSAVPAERRAKPKRLLISLSVGIIALIFSFTYVIISENLEKMKADDQESYKKVKSIERMIINTFKFRLK